MEGATRGAASWWLEHREGAMLVLGRRRAPVAARPSPCASRRWSSEGGRRRPGARAHPLARCSRAPAASAASPCSTVPTRSCGSAPTADVSERLLREYAMEAGLDPFFATVQLPDRLAILLDRARRPPAAPATRSAATRPGLLARLLRRIDLLKAEGVTPRRLRLWAEAEVEAAARRPGARARPSRGRVRRVLRAPRRHPARERAAWTRATSRSSWDACCANAPTCSRPPPRASSR